MTIDVGSTRPHHTAMCWIVGFMICLHAFGAVIAHISGFYDVSMTGAFIDSGSTFLLLSTFWRGAIPRMDRGFLTVLALAFGIPAVVHVAMGASLLISLWIAIGLLVEAFVLGGIYRAFRALRTGRSRPKMPRDTWYQQWQAEWLPVQAIDIVGLFAGAVVSALVAGLWGVSPIYRIGVASSTDAWLFIINVSVTALIGVPCVLLILQRPLVELRRHRLVLLLALIAFSAYVVTTILGNMNLPLSWVLLIPSLIAGSLLRPWAAAVHSLSMAGVALFTANSKDYLLEWQGSVPAEAVLEILVGVSVVVALIWSLLQQERQRLLNELRTERAEATYQAAMLETVMTGMRDGIVVTDLRGRLKYYNPTTDHLLDTELEGFNPRQWPDHVSAVTRSGRISHDNAGIQELWADPSDPVTHIRITAPDGQVVRTLELSHRLISDQDEERVILLLHDVTAQLQRETALRSFAAAAAHDLKGPLTSLVGWVDMARDSSEPDSKMARMLDNATRGSDRLRKIIDDWLAYSVVRDGELEAQQVELAPIVHDVIQGLATPDESGRTPSIDVDVTGEAFVDPPLLRQVLSNLLTNALKYRRDGVLPQIRVSADRVGSDWVRVSVTDNGIGIPPGDEMMLFEMFHRAPSIAQDYDGTGIGLSMVRDIVARHGGEVTAAPNVDGPGSTFSFTVPARRTVVAAS